MSASIGQPHTGDDLQYWAQCFAKVFNDEDQATVLLRRLGFPLERVPKFSTPLVFWSRVLGEVHKGLVPGGISLAVEHARRLYPSNTKFRAATVGLNGGRLNDSPAIRTKTQLRLAEVLAPWSVGWDQNEPGIDGCCQIIDKPYDERDSFFISLKGAVRTTRSGITKTIAVEHVLNWLESSKDVMIVGCRYSQPVLFRWVDESLLAWLDAQRPTWRGQKTVGIHLSDENVLDASSSQKILAHVRHRANLSRSLSDPEVFIKAYARLVGIGARLRDIATQSGSRGPKTEMENLIGKLDSALYAVAIAGRTRAGKSSLINALLGRELSPVGLLPTTAVPMFFQPGNVDSVQVVFSDGKSQEMQVDVEAVKEFATQDQNPRNKKEVREIKVRLESSRLDAGIMLIDAPGLADPNPSMRRATATAMQGVHAVVYVLDAAPFAHGGFALQATDIETLQGFSDLDRIFLVLNKVDALQADQRQQLVDYVNSTLEDHGLGDISPVAPFLTSAKKAIEEQDEGLKALSESLWSFLLERSDIGSVRFERLYGGLRSSGAALHASLLLALNKDVQAKDLRAAARRLTHAKNESVRKWTQRFSDRIEQLHVSVRAEVTRKAEQCIDWLRSTPSDRPIPDAVEINQVLLGGYGEIVKSQGLEVSTWIDEANILIERELRLALHSEKLLSVKVEVSPQPTGPLIALPTRHVPEQNMIQPFIGAAVVGGLAALFGLVESMLGGLIGGLVGFILGEAAKRKDMLRKYARQVRDHAEIARTEISEPLRVWLREHQELFLSRVGNEFDAYTEDLDQRASEASREVHGDQKALSLWLRDVEALTSELVKHVRCPR